MSLAEQHSKPTPQANQSTLIHAQTAIHSILANKDSFNQMDVLIVSIKNTVLNNEIKELANVRVFLLFITHIFIVGFKFYLIGL